MKTIIILQQHHSRWHASRVTPAAATTTTTTTVGLVLLLLAAIACPTTVTAFGVTTLSTTTRTAFASCKPTTIGVVGRTFFQTQLHAVKRHSRHRRRQKQQQQRRTQHYHYYRPTLDACLAIVPPDKAWDRLQRARHLARDKSYTKWPPCLRLLHPFVDVVVSSNAAANAAVTTAAAAAATAIMFDDDDNNNESNNDNDNNDNDIDDMALRIAAVIEKYQIEPIHIRLTEWSIVPHTEALELDWQAMEALPNTVNDDENDNNDSNNDNQDDNDSVYFHLSQQQQQQREDQQVQALIAREEEIGRQNLRKRQARERQKKKNGVIQQDNNNSKEEEEEEENKKSSNDNDDKSNDNNNKNNNNNNNKTALLQKQKRMYEEFNGPAVVCLEPDAESKEQLQALRELLLLELFPTSSQRAQFAPYSMTSSVSSSSLSSSSSSLSLSSSSLLQQIRSQEYRPVVPIAAFPTVSSAIEMARKLRDSWEPLEFDATDLHIISSSSSTTTTRTTAWSSSTSSQQRHLTILAESSYQDNDDECEEMGVYKNREYELFHKRANRSSSSSNNNNNNNNNIHGPVDSWLHQSNEERHLTNSEQFGCDAMIMLWGEEMEMDEQLNKDMFQLVAERGEKGGGDARNDDKTSNTAAALEEDTGKETTVHGSFGDLEQWLGDDDDFDDGTVVVIGRTHFFTGEMRNYVGMPAFSVLNGKDRILGDSISGAARRRGAVHRSSETLKEQGNWEQNENDISAFSKKERTQRKQKK